MYEGIGVGIIGTGRRGYSLAMEIADLSDETGFGVTALCSRTRFRMEETKSALLEKYAEKNLFPSNLLYEHYEDLVNDSNVDLIMIVTPQ